jgi:hypothetical protein
MQRAGTEILFATDEWFAVAGNLNREEPPTFDPNAFDAEGKLMDGCVFLCVSVSSCKFFCADALQRACRSAALVLQPGIP